MKYLGFGVFILFIIRTLFSLGTVLESVGGSGVYTYLGDLTANVLLLIYLNYTIRK